MPALLTKHSLRKTLVIYLLVFVLVKIGNLGYRVPSVFFQGTVHLGRVSWVVGEEMVGWLS